MEMLGMVEVPSGNVVSASERRGGAPYKYPKQIGGDMKDEKTNCNSDSSDNVDRCFVSAHGYGIRGEEWKFSAVLFSSGTQFYNQ